MPKLGKYKIETLLRAPELLMWKRINALGEAPTITPEQFAVTFISAHDRKVLTDAAPYCCWRPDYYGTVLPTVTLEGSRYNTKINFRLHGKEEDDPLFLPPANIAVQDDAPEEPLRSIVEYNDNRISIALEYAKMEAFLKYFVVLCDQDLAVMRYLWPGIVGLDALSQIHEQVGDAFSQVLTQRVPRSLPIVCPVVREHIAMATELTTAGLLMPEAPDDYVPPKRRHSRGSTTVSYEIECGNVATDFKYPAHVDREYYGLGRRGSSKRIYKEDATLSPLTL